MVMCIEVDPVGSYLQKTLMSRTPGQLMVNMCEQEINFQCVEPLRFATSYLLLAQGTLTKTTYYPAFQNTLLIHQHLSDTSKLMNSLLRTDCMPGFRF